MGRGFSHHRFPIGFRRCPPHNAALNQRFVEKSVKFNVKVVESADIWMDASAEQHVDHYDDAGHPIAVEDTSDIEFTLVDGHDGSQHHFLARNEASLRSTVADSTGVQPEAQILLLRAKPPADEISEDFQSSTWSAFSREAVFAAKLAARFDAVCFDRAKVGSSAPIALPPLEPIDVMLPEQQGMFHADDPDVEAAAIDAAQHVLPRTRQAYLQQLLELRLFLTNLQAAAGCIVEGGEERLQSIRLAQSQAGRLQLAFEAATSQTLERCRQLSSDAAAAAAAGEAAVSAATAVAAEVPTWIALLSSIRIAEDDARALAGLLPAAAPGLHAIEEATPAAGGPGGSVGSGPEMPAPARRTLADVLPPGHTDRLVALLAPSQSSAASAASDVRTAVLPSLQQQLHVFSAVVEQAGAHAAGRRDAFAALLTRAAADVASQRRARALVDGAYHAVVAAANTLFAEVLRLADAASSSASGAVASGTVSAVPGSPAAASPLVGDAASPDVAAAWLLLAQPPYSDGAIDAAASTLASADGHLASLQRQAHGLLCEAAQAVNGHLGRVAALQGAAQAASESTADAAAANQALAAVCGELQHLQLLPGAYGALIAERRRRAAFESTLRWAAAAMERSLQRMCDGEAAARRAFAARHAQHLPRSLLANTAALYPAAPSAIALCAAVEQLEATTAATSGKQQVSSKPKPGDDSSVPTARMSGPNAAAAVGPPAAAALAPDAGAGVGVGLWRPLFPVIVAHEGASDDATITTDGVGSDSSSAAAEARALRAKSGSYYGPPVSSPPQPAAAANTVPGLHRAVATIRAAESVCSSVVGGPTGSLLSVISSTAAAGASAAPTGQAPVSATAHGHKHASGAAAASQGHGHGHRDSRRRFSEPASAVAAATAAAASGPGPGPASLATSVATISSGSSSRSSEGSAGAGAGVGGSFPAAPNAVPKRSKSVGAALDTDADGSSAAAAAPQGSHTAVSAGAPAATNAAAQPATLAGAAHVHAAAPAEDAADAAALGALVQSALAQRLVATEAELSSLLAVASLPGWVAARYVRLTDVAAAIAAGSVPYTLRHADDDWEPPTAAAPEQDQVVTAQGAGSVAASALEIQLAPLLHMLQLANASLLQQAASASPGAATAVTSARGEPSSVASPAVLPLLRGQGSTSSELPPPTVPVALAPAADGASLLAPGSLGLTDILRTISLSGSSASTHYVLATGTSTAAAAAAAASAAFKPAAAASDMKSGHEALATVTPVPEQLPWPHHRYQLDNHDASGAAARDFGVPLPRGLPDRLTSQLVALLTAADALVQRATACSASHIAYRAFRVGDSALFFPQGRRADGSGRPLYLAFNDGSSPHCYLDHDGSSSSSGGGGSSGQPALSSAGVVSSGGGGSTPGGTAATLSSSPGAARTAVAGAATTGSFAAPFSLLPAPQVAATAMAAGSGAFPLSVHRRDSSGSGSSGLSGRPQPAGLLGPVTSSPTSRSQAAAAGLGAGAGSGEGAGVAPSSPSLSASPGPLALPAPTLSGSPGLGGHAHAVSSTAQPFASARGSSSSGPASGGGTPVLTPLAAGPAQGTQALLPKFSLALAAPSPIALAPAATSSVGATPGGASSATATTGSLGSGGRWPDFVIGRIMAVRTLGPLSAADIASLKAMLAAASAAARGAPAASTAAGGAAAATPPPSAATAATAAIAAADGVLLAVLQSPFAQLLLTLPAGTSIHLLSVQRLSR